MRLLLPHLLHTLVRTAVPVSKSPSQLAKARRAIVLMLPAFGLVLCCVWLAAESTSPEITDTEYHQRLRVIKNTAAECPNSPLGLVIGSSRTVWAFRPEELPEPRAGEVCWVNAAHVGAGPAFTRVLLYRYLRDGIRPAVAVIEVMPVFFVKENNRFVSGHLSSSELPLFRGYADTPFGYDYYFLRHKIACAPDIASVEDPFAGRVPLLPRGGRREIELDVTPAERQRRTTFVHKVNGEYLQRMTVRPAADRAFRDTLRAAADNGVRVVLLRTPEGPTFRSWYNADGLARFDQYIADVAEEFHAPIVDARLWLEEEDFHDSHHALKRGADKFTTRFAKELPALLAAQR